MPTGTFDEAGRPFDQAGISFDNNGRITGSGDFTMPRSVFGGSGSQRSVGRLYPRNLVSTLNPAFHAGWEVKDDEPDQSYQVLRVKPGTSSRTFGYPTHTFAPGTGIPVSNPDMGLARLISEPLEAQTISGTVRGWFPVFNSFSAMPISSQMRVSLISATGVVKAVLLDYDTTGQSHTWSNADFRPRQFPKGGAGALTPTACVGGDRLLFEIGGRIFGNSGNPGGGGLTIGHTNLAATDLPENEALDYDSDLYHGWFEFSVMPLFEDITGSGTFTMKASLFAGSGVVKEPPGIGTFTMPSAQISGIGVVKGITRVHGYEIQLQTRVGHDHPLWRSPIWEKVVSPPARVRIIDASADPSDDEGVGGAASIYYTGEVEMSAVSESAAATEMRADPEDDFEHFRLFGANAVQRAAVHNCLRLTSYDFDRVMRRFTRATGKTKVPIKFLKMSTVPEVKDLPWVLGFTRYDGTIHIEESLRNSAAKPTVLEEVIFSEMAHVVDRFGLSDNDRDRVKDLMGVPNNVLWRPIPPPADWQDKPAECFMDVWIKCFTNNFHLTITGFKYGLNGHKKRIRRILMPDWTPPGDGGDDDGGGDDGGDDDGGPFGDGTVEIAAIEDKYDGPDLPAGDYSIRYRVWNSDGAYSAWAYDDTLTITGSKADAIIEPDFHTHIANPNVEVRITIMDMESPLHEDDDATQIVSPGEGQYSRGPGAVKAVIEDPGNLGISAFVNSPGELHFTLPNTHSQLSECRPFERHYRLEVRHRGGWKTVHEGLLTDIDVSTDDTIVYGMDYVGLLSLSVETAKQPDGDVDAPMHPPNDGDPTGSKYIQKDIDYIIEDQIDRGRAEDDSTFGWIEKGVIEDMPEPVTIYAAFAQRLEFIRGLLESYASGSGVRSRIEVKRDRADADQLHKINVYEDSGVDRPNLRLEYGSLLQGFELVPFGDFAIRVHGIGHQALAAKPFYVAKSAFGMDPQRWGAISKVALFNNIADENDLTRRVLERANEFARIGKGVAIAIRVRGLDLYDGWDLADALPLSVSHGPVDTSWWQPDDDGLSWWVIWGVQYMVNVDGSDELVLIVRPRIDNTKLLPDNDNHPLLRFTSQHLSGDWTLPSLPPTEESGVLLGVDISSQYQPGFDVGDVKRAGGSFVIAKLTQGTYWDYSGTAKQWIKQTQDKGMVAGAYHFLTRVLKKDGSGDSVAFNTGQKQCDYFIDRLPNKSPEGLLIAVDVESNPNADPFVGPDGKTYHPDKSGARKSQVNQFVKRWFQRFPTHPLLIYSSVAMMPNVDVRAISELTYAWHANYAQDLPNTWDKLDPNDIDFNLGHYGGITGPTRFKQYGPVRIPGYPEGVDADAFHGTKADLLTYTVSASSAPDVTDRPGYRTYYNAVIGAVQAFAPTVNVGAGNTAQEQGEADAKDDIIAAVEALRLTAPDA